MYTRLTYVPRSMRIQPLGFEIQPLGFESAPLIRIRIHLKMADRIRGPRSESGFELDSNPPDPRISDPIRIQFDLDSDSVLPLGIKEEGRLVAARPPQAL